MATRTRGSIPARRTPPPQSPQMKTVQHPRTHPSSTKTTSFAQVQDPKSSQKQIPTRFKSTKTPTTNVSERQSKRSTPGDTARKPTLTRRNTFEGPSSPSTMQSAQVSPNPTLRPSSFSSKTATTQKTSPARKQSALYTRPVGSVKKRFIYVKKQDIGTSATTTEEQFKSQPEKVEASNACDVAQPEQHPKDQESSIDEAKEDATQVGSSDETKADVLVQVDPKPVTNARTEAENDEQDITLAVKTKVAEDMLQVPGTVSNINQEFSEGDNMNEISSSKTDIENFQDNPTSEVEDTKKEPAKTVESDNKEAAGTESEVVDSKETEAAQEVGREEKRETENVAAKTQVPIRGKKESVVSNDVIEETASKLREQRKNKVKALAGAFETVISLQEQK